MYTPNQNNICANRQIYPVVWMCAYSGWLLIARFPKKDYVYALGFVSPEMIFRFSTKRLDFSVEGQLLVQVLDKIPLESEATMAMNNFRKIHFQKLLMPVRDHGNSTLEKLIQA